VLFRSPSKDKQTDNTKKSGIYQPKPTKPIHASDPEDKKRKEQEREKQRELEAKKKAEEEATLREKARLSALKKAGKATVQNINGNITKNIWDDANEEKGTQSSISKEPDSTKNSRRVEDIPTINLSAAKNNFFKIDVPQSKTTTTTQPQKTQPPKVFLGNENDNNNNSKNALNMFQKPIDFDTGFKSNDLQNNNPKKEKFDLELDWDWDDETKINNPPTQNLNPTLVPNKSNSSIKSQKQDIPALKETSAFQKTNEIMSNFIQNTLTQPPFKQQIASVDEPEEKPTFEANVFSQKGPERASQNHFEKPLPPQQQQQKEVEPMPINKQKISKLLDAEDGDGSHRSQNESARNHEPLYSLGQREPARSHFELKDQPQRRPPELDPRNFETSVRHNEEIPKKHIDHDFAFASENERIRRTEPREVRTENTVDRSSISNNRQDYVPPNNQVHQRTRFDDRVDQNQNNYQGQALQRENPQPQVNRFEAREAAQNYDRNIQSNPNSTNTDSQEYQSANHYKERENPQPQFNRFEAREAAQNYDRNVQSNTNPTNTDSQRYQLPDYYKDIRNPAKETPEYNSTNKQNNQNDYMNNQPAAQEPNNWRATVNERPQENLQREQYNAPAANKDTVYNPYSSSQPKEQERVPLENSHQPRREEPKQQNEINPKLRLFNDPPPTHGNNDPYNRDFSFRDSTFQRQPIENPHNNVPAPYDTHKRDSEPKSNITQPLDNTSKVNDNLTYKRDLEPRSNIAEPPQNISKVNENWRQPVQNENEKLTRFDLRATSETSTPNTNLVSKTPETHEVEDKSNLLKDISLVNSEVYVKEGPIQNNSTYSESLAFSQTIGSSSVSFLNRELMSQTQSKNLSMLHSQAEESQGKETTQQAQPVSNNNQKPAPEALEKIPEEKKEDESATPLVQRNLNSIFTNMVVDRFADSGDVTPTKDNTSIFEAERTITHTDSEIPKEPEHKSITGVKTNSDISARKNSEDKSFQEISSQNTQPIQPSESQVKPQENAVSSSQTLNAGPKTPKKEEEGGFKKRASTTSQKPSANPSRKGSTDSTLRASQAEINRQDLKKIADLKQEAPVSSSQTYQEKLKTHIEKEEPKIQAQHKEVTQSRTLLTEQRQEPQQQSQQPIINPPVQQSKPSTDEKPKPNMINLLARVQSQMKDIERKIAQKNNPQATEKKKENIDDEIPRNLNNTGEKPPRHELPRAKPLLNLRIEISTPEVFQCTPVQTLERKIIKVPTTTKQEIKQSEVEKRYTKMLQEQTDIIANDPFKIYSKLNILYGSLPGAEVEYLKALIDAFESTDRSKLPKHAFKKLWLVLVQRLINIFANLTRQSSMPRDRLVQVAALYFLARDFVSQCLEDEQMFKNPNVRLTVSHKKNKEDVDKDKIFKKFIYKFNQDDFDLLKIIKYCRIVLEDRNISADIAASCVYAFLNLLKDMTFNIWDNKFYFKSIPMILHRDIVDRLKIINSITELDKFFSYHSKKVSILNPNSISNTGKVVLHYKDVNVTNLLLYMINFMNYPFLFKKIADSIYSLVDGDTQLKVQYFVLIILLLRDKAELFTSKGEVIKIIKDRMHPEKVYKPDIATIDDCLTQIDQTSLYIIDLLHKLETNFNTSSKKNPKEMLSIPIILSETGILQSKNYLEKSFSTRISQIKDIISKIMGLPKESQASFWTEYASAIKSSLQDTKAEWLYFFDLNKVVKNILSSNPIRLEFQKETSILTLACYELAYFMNKQEFYSSSQDEAPIESASTQILFNYLKLMRFCFVKLQLSEIENQVSSGVELVLLKAFYLANLLECPELERIEAKEILDLLERSTLDIPAIIKDADLKEMLIWLVHFLKAHFASSPTESEQLSSLTQTIAQHLEVPSQSKLDSQSLNLTLYNLFTKETLKSTKTCYTLNLFIQKLLGIQSKEKRVVNGNLKCFIY